MGKIMLPLGIDSFEKLRAGGYYYIDKTAFIEDLLNTQFEVNLITRPRRFGKTLTMSMLADFFDIRKDSRKLFEGLKISENKELCEKWMNQYPVLFITFKDVEDLKFAEAYKQLEFSISNLCMNHDYLKDSDRIRSADREAFLQLQNRTASPPVVKNSLFMLTRMLKEHYQKPVILLIDEYDVPLAKANEHNYYKSMLNVIRGVLSTVLKTNEYLQFSVVTGCLRIAKESIFTGTNNFVSNSISGKRYKRTFGFTEAEVHELLSSTGLESHTSDIKSWYNGYRFSKESIYCPWDVLNYVSDLQVDENTRPASYWKDTSHNDIIRSFIGQENFNVTDKLERLLAGGYVKVKLSDDLTYDLIHSSEENFWSILYLTGYLTIMDRDELPAGEWTPGVEALKIPNHEVKEIFADTIVEWFKDNMQVINRKPLITALWDGEAEKASSILTDLLFQTISYHNYKEDYYHAFMAGIFIGLGYAVESDKEHGSGRPDIIVKDYKNRRVIIIEAKISDQRSQMENDCLTAVNQIQARQYAEEFFQGFKSVVCYGAAFFKKECVLKKIEL